METFSALLAICEGNSSGTGELSTQKASNAENVSIWWRHHGLSYVPAVTNIKKHHVHIVGTKRGP